MSLANIILYSPPNVGMQNWNTTLDASDATPKEKKGAIRVTHDEVLGPRWFMYCRFDQSGGAAADNPVAFRGLVSVSATSNGTVNTVNGSGFATGEYTGNGVLAGGIIRCLDDAGGAGAAPEGEVGLVAKNSATVITLDPASPFSVATGSSDTFSVELPWAVVDSAAGNLAAQVAGVALVTQPQYYWGWVQFAGYHPGVTCVAAGTAITAGKSLIVGTNLVTNGSTSAAELRIGYAIHGVTSDTVRRKVPMKLFCGMAFQFGASA